jgi:hypothetical protein
MNIVIEMSREEASQIVINHLKTMFPGKTITGEVSGYGLPKFEVTENQPEEKGE